TVKQYRSVETQQLGEYQKLAPSAPDELRLAVQGAEGRRSDRIDTIGYDPLEQLKSSSELAPAIDGAAACGDVAEWIDLSRRAAPRAPGERRATEARAPGHRGGSVPRAAPARGLRPNPIPEPGR